MLAVAVATIYAEHHGRYGSPRVQIELRERGQRSGRKRIARLMRAHALRARPKRRYRTTTDSRHGLPISPNLLGRRFTVTQPNTAWVTDMTYLWTPGRLALSGRDHRSVLTASGGLVDEPSGLIASWRWTRCAWPWRNAVRRAA